MIDGKKWSDIMNIIDKITAKQLRNDIPEFRVGDTVKVDVKIIEGKVITVKNQECVEFQLPVDQAGKYQVQVKCTYSFQESYSNKFTYTSEEVIG